jgi:NADH:ubiquinone oxidoreductase subunit K
MQVAFRMMGQSASILLLVAALAALVGFSRLAGELSAYAIAVFLIALVLAGIAAISALAAPQPARHRHRTAHRK